MSKNYETNDEKKLQMQKALKENEYVNVSRSWDKIQTGGELHPYAQGWKLHITVETPEEFIRGVEILGPEIKRLNIENKISSVETFDKTNLYKMSKNAPAGGAHQYGKNIVLYLNDLTKLQEMSEEAKSFLMEPIDRTVPTDLHLGGRVNARYVSYYQDGVMNLDGKVTEVNRDTKLDQYELSYFGEQRYKPSFVENPPNLKEILTMDRILHPTKFEPHREDLLEHLIRTGKNNDLIKEMILNTPSAYYKHNNEEINENEYSKVNISGDRPVFDGKTIKEHILESKNEELISFLKNIENNLDLKMQKRGVYEPKELESTRENELAKAYTYISVLNDKDNETFKTMSLFKETYMKELKQLDNLEDIQKTATYLLKQEHYENLLKPEDLKFLFEKAGISKDELTMTKEIFERKINELENSNLRVPENEYKIKLAISVLEKTLDPKVVGITQEKEVVGYLNDNQRKEIIFQKNIEKIEEEFKNLNYKFENESEKVSVKEQVESININFDKKNLSYENVKNDVISIYSVQDEKKSNAEFFKYIDDYSRKNGLDTESSLLDIMRSFEETDLIEKLDEKNRDFIISEIEQRYDDLIYVATENVKEKEYYKDLDKDEIKIATIIEKSRLAIYDRTNTKNVDTSKEYTKRVMEEIKHYLGDELKPKDISKKMEKVITKEYLNTYKDKNINGKLERKDKEALRYMGEVNKNAKEINKANSLEVISKENNQREL